MDGPIEGVPDTTGGDHFTLTLATLNTRGLPLLQSGLPERCAAIGAGFEQSAADMVLCQEVITYYHLAQLNRALPSYTAWYRRSGAGPAGGLVTFSKVAPQAATYLRFPPPRAAGLPPGASVRARLKGMLITVLREPGPLAIINTHTLANADGDWSDDNRFHGAQAGQLGSLRRVIAGQEHPVIVAGDFNMPAASVHFGNFIDASRLKDAFDGDCPPTFRAEFLPPGRVPQCIDFILCPQSARVKDHGLMFTASSDGSAGSGPVSDHLGLFATVTISAGH